MKTESTLEISGAFLLFLVFLIFLILKLVGVIDWSWWWVTCPLWIGAALFLSIIFIVAVFAAIFK